MTKPPMKIEVLDVTQIVLSTDPADGSVIVCKGFGGGDVVIHLSPQALVKLEAFLARANVEQAKRQPSH